MKTIALLLTVTLATFLGVAAASAAGLEGAERIQRVSQQVDHDGAAIAIAGNRSVSVNMWASNVGRNVSDVSQRVSTRGAVIAIAGNRALAANLFASNLGSLDSLSQ